MSPVKVIQAPFFSAAGEAKGAVDLSASLFQESGSRYVLHEALVAWGRNRRRGTSDTKRRGEVRGGGHKPWKQKGTGNARAGSIRSPLWRKGGIIFGPHPRSYRVDLNRSKKTLALQTALLEKARASEVAILEGLPAGDGKTRQAQQFLAKTGLTGRVLMVVDRWPPELARSFRNLAHFEVADVQQLHAGLLMSARKVLFTQAALEALRKRFLTN